MIYIKMLDNQKQAQELNCKLIAGKVGISNVDDFLAVLKIFKNSQV